MKRLIMVSLMLIMITLLAGCVGEEKEEKKLESIADNGIETVKKPEGVKIVTDVTEYKKVTDDQKYNIESDDSLTVRSEYGIAESEEAYYFIERYCLHFYEKETGEYRIACNKPDCMHSNERKQCNAYINTNGYNAIRYYEGFIYYVEQEGNDFNLYKKSVESGTTEKVLNIESVEQKATSDSNMQICWVIHRGYIYYVGQFGAGITEDSYYLNDSNCLTRIKLDGASKPEILMALPAEGMMVNPYFTNIQASGSYVYFMSPYYNETYADLVSSVYRYNTEANQIEVLDVGEVSWINYMVSGDKIYYKRPDCGDKLYVYDADTNTSTEFLSMENGQTISSLLPYKEGIMVDAEKCCCYGEDGAIEAVIENVVDENIDRCLPLGGDDEKIFFQVDYTLDYAEKTGRNSCIAYYDIKVNKYVFLE